MSRLEDLTAIIQEQDRIINDCDTKMKSDPFGLNIRQNNALYIQKRQAERIKLNANTELQKEMNKSTGQTKDIETKDYIIGIAANVQRIADNTEKEAPDNGQTNFNVQNVITALMQAGEIIERPERKIKERTFPREYWIKTSVQNVENYLTTHKELQVENPRQFMINYLKGKKGGNIANSFKTEKVKKRKQS
jgi:hypothetical protein